VKLWKFCAEPYGLWKWCHQAWCGRRAVGW
jgi:hypothetical protein